jgi:hypothetical protein
MNQTLFLTALILVVFLIHILVSTNSISAFEHNLPKERYPDLLKEFGSPTYTVNRKCGVAIWKQPQFFEKIMLKDESIEHKSPKPHCDFLYSTIKVHIEDNQFVNLLMLSESVTYDRLKKELTARCHFMGANVATLLLCMMIAENPGNRTNYYRMYGDMIMKSTDSQQYKIMKKELEQRVLENQKMWAGMFPNTSCK